MEFSLHREKHRTFLTAFHAPGLHSAQCARRHPKVPQSQITQPAWDTPAVSCLQPSQKAPASIFFPSTIASLIPGNASYHLTPLGSCTRGSTLPTGCTAPSVNSGGPKMRCRVILCTKCTASAPESRVCSRGLRCHTTTVGKKNRKAYMARAATEMRSSTATISETGN